MDATKQSIRVDVSHCSFVICFANFINLNFKNKLWDKIFSPITLLIIEMKYGYWNPINSPHVVISQQV